MKNVNIRIVVLLGAFSIASIILFQVYWMYHTFNITSDQFSQRVKIALYSVAQRMADYSDVDLPYDVVSQVTSNYFVVNVATHIDATVLEHYLQTVFKEHNIDLDCEYAIYNCETNAMMYGNYLGSNELRNERKSSPGAFEKQEGLVYYFGVIFPNRTSYLLQNINVWMISSGIVLMALLFFSYSVFVILRQKRLSEIQKDFINNMTHEFKTPISSIAIASHVLLEDRIEADPERFHRYARIIGEQNSRLQQQIERVLQIVTMEKSRDGIRPEPLDLHRVIRELVANYPLGDVNVQFRLDAVSTGMMADRFHFENIMYNLLDNAIKYGGKDVEIVLSSMNKARRIELSVSDNGPGIEKKYLKRIFDKFFRVPSGNIHTVKGFGLGLYYVKRVAEDHGWKISATSQPGKGTTITLMIKESENE